MHKYYVRPTIYFRFFEVFWCECLLKHEVIFSGRMHYFVCRGTRSETLGVRAQQWICIRVWTSLKYYLYTSQRFSKF